MDLGLADRVALVTGGTRGIGLGIAATLLQEGCTVVIAGKSAASAESAGAHLRAVGGEVSVRRVDLREHGAASRLVADVVKSYGGVDVVVNCAAAFVEGDLLDSPLDEWEQLFRLKLLGYLEVARAAIPSLRARGGGSILNVAGIAAVRPILASAHAGAINAAVLSLTQVLAKAVAGWGIRVNALSPGSVRTDRFTARVARTAEQRGCDLETAERVLAAAVPTGRVVEVDEIATVAALLCAPRVPSLVGAHVVVDGGRTL